MRAWLVYSGLRIGLFAGVFVLLLLLGIEWWLAAIIAAVIGFAVTYIFFGRLRDRVALELAERRQRPAADPDAEAEDAAGSDAV